MGGMPYNLLMVRAPRFQPLLYLSPSPPNCLVAGSKLMRELGSSQNCGAVSDSSVLRGLRGAPAISTKLNQEGLGPVEKERLETRMSDKELVQAAERCAFALLPHPMQGALCFCWIFSDDYND